MQSINLIKLSNNKIIINQQALTLFTEHDGPISIISVCGEYRTGKSFLLNSLFQADCFDVSSTTQACTKGINMIARPIMYQGRSLWIFDTEGFGSLDMDSKYDAKIFLLTILMSQVLIYNSMGAIDQVSISKIALMCKEAEHLILSQSSESNKKNEGISEQLVKNIQFYWVLRDFSLSLIDKNGNKIEPNQYLEQAMKGNSQKLQIQRKSIRKMFKDRYCFPLVRPCISEKSLHTLKDIPSSNLRPQFLQQIQEIKQHIHSNVKSKSLYNSQINGKQFSELIKCYVKMINQSNFSTELSVTWEQIQANQRQQILLIIEQQIDKKIVQYEKMMPLGRDELYRLSKQIKMIVSENTKDIIKNEGQVKLIEQQCKKVKQQKIQKLTNKNNIKIKQKCEVYLEDYFKQFLNKMINLAIPENFNEMFDGQIQKLKKNYQLRFKSYQISVVNQEYTSIIQRIVSQLIPTIVKKWSEQEGKKAQRFEQLRKQKKNLQSQIRQKLGNQDSLSKQLSIAKKMYEQSQKQISNYIEIISRMQKVAQNLRKQFQILQHSQNQAKNTLQLKTLQFDQKLRKQKQLKQILQLQLQQIQISHKSKCQQIETLKKQMKLQKQVHQQQLTSKLQGILIVLNTEREHFQQLIIQKNSSQNQLKKQLQEQMQINIKIREQLTQSMNFMKTQFQTTVAQINYENSQKIYEQESQMIELKRKIMLLQTQNQKLYQQYDHKIMEGEAKNEKLSEMKSKIRENQKIYLQKQAELIKQIEKLKVENVKLQKQKQNLSEKIQEIGEKAKINMDKSKQQLEIMNRKMQQNVQNFQTNSKMKYDLLRKQFIIQKQEIVLKLTQAAERIQKMGIKQQKLTDKIQNYEQEIKNMKQKLTYYENEQCRECVSKQIRMKQLQNQFQKSQQNNIQLKQIINIQLQQLSRYKAKLRQQNQKQITHEQRRKENKGAKYGELQQDKCPNNTQITQQIQELRKQIQRQKDQNNRLKMIGKKKQEGMAETIETYKTKVQKIQKINQNLKRQLQIYKQQRNANDNTQSKLNQQQQIGSPHFSTKKQIKQNPQNYLALTSQNQKIKNASTINIKQQLTLKIQQLSKQNKKLKQQLQDQKQKVDKMRTQSMKQINLHAFFKKSLKETNDHSSDTQNQTTHKQNIFSKTCQENTNNVQITSHGHSHINWPQKLTMKQKQIQTLQKKIDELTDNQIKYSRKAHQLNNILLKQRQQLSYLQLQIVKYIQQLNLLKQQKQNIRNKLQAKMAEYVYNYDRLTQQMQNMNKKYNCLNKETQLWKIKALQYEDRQKNRPQRNSAYRQKIDELFNKI